MRTGQVFGVIGLIVLAGCAPTLAEVRALPPEVVQTYPVAAEGFSACFLDQMLLHHGAYQIALTREGETIHLTPTIVGPPAALYSWTIDFVPNGSGSSRVEVRSLHTVWGAPEYPDDLMATIMHCGVAA